MRVPLATIGLALILVTSATFAQETLRDKPLVSPRLAALKKNLEAGKREALESFWQDVETRGAPLVESIQGDETHMWVTFLWRAQEETTNVLVHSWFGNNLERLSHDEDPIHDNLMVQLRETDVWYKTYRVRNDARTIYLLAPNHSLIPSRDVKPEEMAKHFATYRLDPLNPRSHLAPRHDLWEGKEDVKQSIVELPAAPPQPWVKVQVGVPKGAVKLHRVTSKILGNQRRIWVYTPPAYKPGGSPYHLLVLFDGWYYSQTMPTSTILDNLIAQRGLPPIVAVMVDEPTLKDRLLDLGCYAPFNDFLAVELIPWIRRQYHVTEEPGRTIVGGLSRGGLAAAYAAFQHPDIFGNVISQSGYFSWPSEDGGEREFTGKDNEELDRRYGWLIRQYVSSTMRPLRFYLEAGLYEELIFENRHMRDVLRAKGHKVYYSEFSGGHDFLVWQGTLADALLLLLKEETRNREINQK